MRLCGITLGRFVLLGSYGSLKGLFVFPGCSVLCLRLVLFLAVFHKVAKLMSKMMSDLCVIGNGHKMWLKTMDNLLRFKNAEHLMAFGIGQFRLWRSQEMLLTAFRR